MLCARESRWLFGFGGMCTLAVALAAVAADPPEKQAAAQPDAAKNTHDKEAAEPDAKALREQTIYVPYSKLNKVFEQHGRGVFIPYEKFQELWQAAQKATVRPDAVKPPVGALIARAENEATVAKDVVRVKARLKIELLTAGWHELPLRLADSAVTAAMLGDQPARITGTPESGYRLLIESKQPESRELTLEYAKAITKTPGQNHVTFEAPQAAVSRWNVRIPESGVKVNVQPQVATTEVPAPAAKPGEKARPADETVIEAFVGAAPTVRIEWTPKAEGATGLEALASVLTEQQVWIKEGVTRTRAKLAYSISRAELGQLALEVPADQKVVNVSDANVRQWTVAPAGDLQKVSVSLFEPAKASQEIIVELERYAADKAGSLRVPQIKALNVGRQSGLIVVAVDDGQRAEVTRSSGLMQTDQGDMPGELARTHWNFSYRYASIPFELTLDVEKVLPRILADSLLEAYLEPERVTLDLSVLYTIERAGVFRLELEQPAGFQVRFVRGRDMPGATAAAVDGYHLEGDKKDRLVVDLSRKALGRVALCVELQKDLQEPALATPGDKSADVPVPLPRVLGDVERSTGRALIYAPESLRVNPGTVEGLRSVSFGEALQGMASARDNRFRELRPVLAYAHSGEATKLSLAAQRRKPQVTIGQLLAVRVEDGVVKYQSTLFYNVLYSGVKALRLDVPKAIAGKLRVATAGVREKELDPPPKDLAPDTVAWSLAGESEWFGSGRIELVWEDEKDMGKLEIGKSATIPVPRLAPRDVDRAWGQIVLSKAESIDVEEAPDASGLRPIDPQHDLMPGANVSGAARAFEFHDDWKLAVVATRYRLEEVKRTSIDRALVRMVLTRADQVSVQALYRLRSAQQRLELALPAGVQFDSNAVHVNGRPVILERGRQDRFFIPLTNATPDESLLLELNYTAPGGGEALDLPDFPAEPAVQKVYVAVYVPQEKLVLGRSGPWSDEFDWAMTSDLHWQPLPRTDDRTDRPLVQWVLEGKQAQAGPSVGNFQTDGRLYLFSTLQPAAPPLGTLHLSIVRQTLLTGLLLGGLVVMGLVLAPARIGLKSLAVAALVIGLVVLGLFAPNAAWQILDGKLAAALLAVLAVWAAVCAYQTRAYWAACCRSPAQAPRQSSAKVKAEPTPEPPPLVTEAKPEGEQQGGADHV